VDAYDPRRLVSDRTRTARRPGRELALLGGLYLLYQLVRWLSAGGGARARANARWILGVERSAHVAIERPLQHALSFAPADWILANVYLVAQLLVLPAALVWLYLRAPAVYRRLRDTMVAAWLLALPVFALFPVAPPRLARIGMADTVSSHGVVALGGSSTLFYNPYAAVPSLHVALAYAVGLAFATAGGTRLTRLAGLLWGPLVSVAVIATANHYLFDVGAGLATAGLGLLLSGAGVRLLRGRPLARRALSSRAKRTPASAGAARWSAVRLGAPAPAPGEAAPER
jgi:hypothetical protein